MNDELVCGRGILSGNRLYVPIDSPAVVEVDTTNGEVVEPHWAEALLFPATLFHIVVR